MRSIPRDERPAQAHARWLTKDIDGDGLALAMRVRDPGGEMVESPEFPGLLLPRTIDDAGPYYKIYPEGVIENFDGANVPSPYFLSDNQTDLNRNFPYMWAPDSKQEGAGAYPLSEVESRSVVDFTARHPEIYLWLNLHTFGGVFIRPLGDKPDTKMNQQDLALFRQLGAWAEEITGYPMVSGSEEFTYEPDTPLHGSRPVYPHFRSKGGGHFAPPIEFDSTRLGRRHRIRVYLPPGYDENTLKRYPVLYMQDGQNLFFPDEAFLGNDWHVDETVGVLDTMSVVDDFIVVAVYSKDRLAEYTKPGYETYGKSLVGEVKPRIDQDFRTLPGPYRTALLGSSLGGVVSFYLAWEWPDVFGRAACLSSTFGYRDDLFERVLSEEKRDAGFYLDSGWPGDNYEITLSMAMALVSRGWVFGRDLIHFAFPLAEHDEKAWGLRLHMPMQLFSGIVRHASEVLHPD